MSREILFSVTKKDLEITWYSGTGKGGQHRNKHMNCCRIKHPDSGVIVTCCDNRQREKNLREAFRRLTVHHDFLCWHRIKTAEMMMQQQSIDDIIDEQMKEENLLIETYTPE